jgi:hypothetical protein
MKDPAQWNWVVNSNTRGIVLEHAANYLANPTGGTRSRQLYRAHSDSWRSRQASSLSTLKFVFSIASVKPWTATLKRAYALCACRPSSQAPATVLNSRVISCVEMTRESYMLYWVFKYDTSVKSKEKFRP